VLAAIPLVELLRACSRAEAVEWAEVWLRSHPGTGSIVGGDDDQIEIEHAAYAREILGRLVDAAGTPAAAYLESRGIAGFSIAGPSLAGVTYLPDARTGEGAIGALLAARGRTVGAQIGYLDPDGRKSTVYPTRRRFMVEKAADAVFEISSPASVIDLHVDLFICEGIENALSLQVLGRPVRIVGLPGIGTLRHLPVRRGERVVVVRDGDEPNSAADKALTAGIDHLLLEDANVQITATPAGEDANSILQSGGTAALSALLSDTYSPELSIAGEFVQLSRLDLVDYERERKLAAGRLGLRVSVVDAEVARRREAGSTRPAAAADVDTDDIELLDEPVDLAETLDAILTELQRYVVSSETALATVALWTAHTHLCHHAYLRLQRTPRLAVQARTPGSGKTTLLETVAALVPRPRVAASLTASTVLRVVDQLHPVLLIDEADRVLYDQNSDLLSILNAGDRRATAWVERSIPTSDGGWEVKRFSVWGPVAFAGIDELPPTQQDRSIVVQMQKALDRDIPDHLEDGNSTELVLLRRKLATWAHDLEEFPRPVMPDVLTRQAGRIGDNWRVLFAVAQLARGRWPGLVERAALEAVNREGSLTVVQRLLESVHRVFQQRASDRSIRTDDDKIRITTPDLIAALLADDQDEWSTSNRGRAVTWYWLRDNFRHLLDPPGTKEWEGPASGGQRGKRYRGYLKSQFERAWERHLPSSLFTDASKPSTVSAGSAEDEENQADTGNMASAGENSSAGTTDQATADTPTYRTTLNGKNPSNSATSLDTVDTVDDLDGQREQQDRDDPVPNGADLSGLDLEIAVFGAANPKWATGRIAKRFGQPRDVVARLLGRER
jgi:hypothetical protein